MSWRQSYDDPQAPWYLERGSEIIGTIVTQNGLWFAIPSDPERKSKDFPLLSQAKRFIETGSTGDPLKPYVVEYQHEFMNKNAWVRIARFAHSRQAKAYARRMAKKYPNRTIRVITE